MQVGPRLVFMQAPRLQQPPRPRRPLLKLQVLKFVITPFLKFSIPVLKMPVLKLVITPLLKLSIHVSISWKFLNL